MGACQSVPSGDEDPHEDSHWGVADVKREIAPLLVATPKAGDRGNGLLRAPAKNPPCPWQRPAFAMIMSRLAPSADDGCAGRRSDSFDRHRAPAAPCGSRMSGRTSRFHTLSTEERP
jgi:hypothetical protein